MQLNMDCSVVAAWIIAILVFPACQSDSYDPPFGCSGKLVNDVLRESVLVRLNMVRKQLVEGNILVDQANNPLPTAGNMYKLIWNCSLEAVADTIVENCDANGANKPVLNGVNYIDYDSAQATQDQIDSPLEPTLEDWSGQSKTVAMWPADNKYASATMQNALQFSNIILSKTVGVGCSQKTCQSKSSAACVFEQPGVAEGTEIYTAGAKCTDAKGCTTYPNSMCDTGNYNGLCYLEPATTTIASTSTAPTTTAPTTTAPTTTSAVNIASTTTNAHPNPAVNQICPTSPDMNDRIRTKALDMHNYRRRRLANGKVAKFNGNLFPQASDMLSLRYDCQLEMAAKLYADQCQSSESTPSIRPGIEENVHRVAVSSASTRVLATEEAIKSWWKVVKTDRGIGVKLVTFRSHHVSAPIRTFTRMAWSTTTFLGCGVSRCGSDFNVVCRYSPGGNIVDRTVYTQGAPCTRCPLGFYCRTPLCVSVV